MANSIFVLYNFLNYAITCYGIISFFIIVSCMHTPPTLYSISTSTFFATASSFGQVALTSSLIFASECGTLDMTC